MNCAKCKVSDKICRKPDGHGPEFCPSQTRRQIIDQALAEYDRPRVQEFARQASIQEGECFANRHLKPYVMQPVKTRLLELIEFAREMGYRRLGLAFCAGVAQEAGVLTEVLENNGFEVVGVACKVGGVPKERIGLKDDEKIHLGQHESMCNPIAQAMLLNEAQTDFNIAFRLCVGHDSLFFNYAESLTTVLAVKDRVTGHNPMAALYTVHSYHQKLKKGGGGSQPFDNMRFFDRFAPSE